MHDGGEAAPTFSIQANDGAATNNLSNVFDGSVAFTNVNDAPVTTPVTLAPIAEDSGPHLITQADLLINASDVENNTLTASNLQIASGTGLLVDNGDGTWTYTPALNDDTSVSFSYTITDNGTTNGVADPKSVSGSASLDITPVNDAPVTTPVTLAAIAEDSGAAHHHPGPTVGQCVRCRAQHADGEQPADCVRHWIAGRQRQRHLDLHAGAQ